MANLFLVIMMCLPLVMTQRHRILCAIEGVEGSPLCSRSSSVLATTTPTLLLHSNMTVLIPTTLASPNSFDYYFEYFCLPAIVFVLYILHVLYLHFGKALPWTEALGFFVLRLVAIYRAAIGPPDGHAEVVCCPKVYTLCMETNVVGQTFNLATPTGVATIDV
jgi:hypothetical protein